MFLVINIVIVILLAGCLMYAMVLVRRNFFKLKALESIIENQLTCEDVVEIIEENRSSKKSKTTSRSKE